MNIQLFWRTYVQGCYQICSCGLLSTGSKQWPGIKKDCGPEFVLINFFNFFFNFLYFAMSSILHTLFCLPRFSILNTWRSLIETLKLNKFCSRSNFSLTSQKFYYFTLAKTQTTETKNDIGNLKSYLQSELKTHKVK